jgi:Big-like domain-containing protein
LSHDVIITKFDSAKHDKFPSYNLHNCSRTSMNDHRSRIIISFVCGILIVVSLLTFMEQIPAIPITDKIYEKEYVRTLEAIGNLVPTNETLTTNTNYPQTVYFSDHKVKIPRVDSESSLVRFMWNINSSYLLIAEDISISEADKTPLLVQLVEKPFEKIFDYYYESVSEPKTNATLALHSIINDKLFKRFFQKTSEYNTEGTILHLYHLRPNITQGNLDIVTDITKPMLHVSSPVNNTIIESESNTMLIQITGIATDLESNIKKVELSVNGSPFRLTDPSATNDWSSWSLSYIFTSNGTKRIVAKATDNADNEKRYPFYITIR